MRIKTTLLFAASTLAAATLTAATPAFAQDIEPIMVSENVSLDISGNARLRYEHVSQDNAVADADALTLRGRLGATLSSGGFSALVEGEGTVALIDDFNDTIPSNGIEARSVVADPDSLELNRAQISYMVDGNGATLGRQRINHANQRFLGAVGWRQNEQTFDAVRGQFAVDKFSLDAAYSNSQRTIFGSESPNSSFDGDFVFLKGDYDGAALDVSVFSYLIDYDTRLAFSSDTYGLSAAFKVPGTPIMVKGSYAAQTDAGANPVNYSADYFFGEVGGSIAGLNLSAGYEELGSDDGVAAFQTPLATLHAFNGWADLFLATPATGLRDYYGKASKKFTIAGLTTFTATIVYHEFDADFGGASYGSEIDAALGFKIGKVGMLVKYANYNADAFGVDTEKLWVQAGISF